MNRRIVACWVVACCALSTACLGAGAEEYLAGGPLAGVKLPLYATQHGEPPGYPGCIPELAAEALAKDPKSRMFTPEGVVPEPLLYPGSVEHWRTYWGKYLPLRSFFDRQSLLKNWQARDIPGVKPDQVESYAEPVYWVGRFTNETPTGRSNKPVSVVRCRPGSPVFELDCGELEAGLYAVRVIAAVETKDIVRHRKPVYLRMMVNDGLEGEVSTYKLRVGYVDEFYSIAEFYFHAPARRTYRATLCVTEGSLADLLVHNIALDDALAGTTRRAIKTKTTLASARQPAEPPPADKEEARWARDAELWSEYPPINAQFALYYGMGGDDSKSNWPNFGAGGRTQQEIDNEWGTWRPGAGPVLAVNQKLNLTYSLEDFRARRPLPDPYPFKDDGAGVYTPPAKPDENGQNWLPVSGAVQARAQAYVQGIRDAANRYQATGNPVAGRDAAVRLVRFAWDFPALDPANAINCVLVQPGPYGRDIRCRRRDHTATLVDVNFLQHYDQLFEFIRGNEDLARSIGRFVPWVASSQDVVQLLDVYLVQTMAKRVMRYEYHWDNAPTLLLTPVTVLGDPSVTDPWMEWLFSSTFVYPMAPSGLQDLLVTGYDRDGMGYIASYAYALGESAAPRGEEIEKYIVAGGNPKYDLRDPQRYPKPLGTCYFFLRSRMAGLYFPRVGDVTGPDKAYAAWFDTMEAMARRGWRWSRDPQFAYVLKNFFPRRQETDEEWKAIEDAAATVRRAPWLENRSRALPFWCGVLESGVEHDDFRFRRAAMVRIGEGYGHSHNDTLDLQIYSHGYPMTIDGGQRGGYSKPGDGATRVHNVVEVDNAGWKGYSWLRTLTDAPGARYMMAEAVPPLDHPDVRLHRRQVALIDVDEGSGSKPLTPGESRGRLDLNAVSPNSYTFDVARVDGGKTHTYCFHGTVEDELVTNAEGRQGAQEMPDADKQYLGMFRLPETWFAGNAPEVFEATWRMTRGKEYGNEQGMAGSIWNEASPRKYTRLYVLGHKGARVLSAPLDCHQWKYRFTNVYVQERGGAAASVVFPAIIEPFVGEPFIVGRRLAAVADNETDALRAVAVEVKTRNGHTEVCFADGRPDRVRNVEWKGGPGEASRLRIAGEFAFYSTDGQGLRQAALTGGTLLEGPDAALRPAARERSAKVTKADYLNRTYDIDRPWPALLKGRVFEIGVPGRMTSCTVVDSRPAGEGGAVTLLGGADFYLSRVQEVEPDKALVHTGLGFPQTGSGDPSPGMDKNWVASNEAMTKFWRADYVGGSRSERRYTFRLSPPAAPGQGGAAVSLEDFGATKGFYLWEYGVGDSARMSTFASIRRTDAGYYELAADVDVVVALPGRSMEASADGAAWRGLTVRQAGDKVEATLRVEDLTPAGTVYLRVR